MQHSNGRHRGLTLVEVVISMAIISTALTAGLRTMASFSQGQRAAEQKAVAMALANQLMAEINMWPYEDPVSGSTTFGLESGEIWGNRTTYDDIDDYNGLSLSPPTARNGDIIAGYDDYSLCVSISYYAPASTAFSGFPSNSFKSITVQVYKSGVEMARLTTIRGRHNGAS